MNPFRILKNINKPMEDLSMRTLVILIAVMVTLFITSCSTTYYSTNPPAYDDVYYTTPVAPVATETVVITDYTDNPSYNGEELYGEGEFISDEEVYEFYEPSYQDSYSYTDPDGATYITNNYYGDYNDYSYTSRIRRFYDPCYSSYYCDYYTNPYAYDPYYYGSNWSLSIGFGWGWGSYGFSWGYPYYYNPYYSWGYPSYGWYDPWFGYPYYGYNSYWAGYWDGYYDGYYGYYPDGGYYPDYSSVYYGPRTSREGTNNPGSGNRGTTGDNLGNDQPAAGLRTGIEQTSNRSSMNASDRIAEDTRKEIDLTRQSYNPATDETNVARESNQNPVTTRSSSETKTASDLGSFNDQNNQGTRYTKAVTAQPEVSKQSDPVRSSSSQSGSRTTYSKPKTYNSPVYTRPKSSQEYKAPGSDNTRQYSQPENQRNTYTKPANVVPRSTSQPNVRSGNAVTPSSKPSNTRTYSAPSQPSRSYSAPQRSSSPSYSAPSGSSGSYSAPSRSSSSSGNSGGRR